MASRYEIGVIDRQTGKTVAVWPPGREAERDFVAAVTALVCKGQREFVSVVVASVREKRVGWFRGEAVVTAAVQASLESALPLEATVQAALESALHDLKASVKP